MEAAAGPDCRHRRRHRWNSRPLDGTARCRGRAIRMHEDPLRFFQFRAGVLAASLFVVIGWIALRSEWNIDYRPCAKPSIEDPDRKRPFSPGHNTLLRSHSLSQPKGVLPRALARSVRRQSFKLFNLTPALPGAYYMVGMPLIDSQMLPAVQVGRLAPMSESAQCTLDEIRGPNP